MLHESVNRILSIAAVHEVLSQRGFRLVDVKDVLTRVGRAVAHNMRRPDLAVEVTIEKGRHCLKRELQDNIFARPGAQS